VVVCIRVAWWLRKRLIIWIVLNSLRTGVKVTIWEELARNGRTVKKLKFTIGTVCRFNEMRILFILYN
jgi:hypothetical protein